MVLTPDEVARAAAELHEVQVAERQDLDIVRRYWTGKQRLPAVIPATAPAEVRTMARTSRVNVTAIVVESLAQSLFVDDVRAADVESDDDVTLPVWQAWQANRMDKRQIGVHRAAIAYGTAYTVTLPGDPMPVIRGVSPRSMTARYSVDDPDWPVDALERRAPGVYHLYDGEAVYWLRRGGDGWLAVGVAEHPFGVCPVVRFTDVDDLDREDEPEPESDTVGRDTVRLTAGRVAPMMPLQDQINLTSFNLKVAEWYSAFRQRYIIGWTAESESQKVHAAASQMWTFDQDPDETKVGEFGQTDLRGYLDSREAALKYAATLSQTPVHELVGELVNLSAEALAAAEAGRDRLVDMMQTSLSESWEQTLGLAGRLMGVEIPADAQVVWRDTSARAFGAVVDGLGKLAQMLGVPPAELWSRIPGVTRQDVRRFRAAAEQGDALTNLTAMLERQAGGERASAGGLILPPGVEA